MTQFALDEMDLAALLCSRVCHDVISPVGAIVNGLEVLDDEKDAEIRTFAFDLIKKSARTASAQLQFCRLAFGAAGSAGASIDTGDAESVTRGLITDERVTLEWRGPRQLAPKNKVKLVLNLCTIAIAAIPRGGVISVELSGEGPTFEAHVEARGANARLASGVSEMLAGTPESGAGIDARSIQPFFTGLVARACGMRASVEAEPGVVKLRAVPEAAEMRPSARMSG